MKSFIKLCVMGQCVGQLPSSNGERASSTPVGQHLNLEIIQDKPQRSLVPSWLQVPSKVAVFGKDSEKNMQAMSNLILPVIELTPPDPAPVLLKRPAVSDWHSEDTYFEFLREVRNGDVVEMRKGRIYHWGIALKTKGPKNCISVFHVNHGFKYKGRAVLMELEDYWESGSRLRINNTIGGGYLDDDNLPVIELIEKAFKACNATDTHWHDCLRFVQDCTYLNITSNTKSLWLT